MSRLLLLLTVCGLCACAPRGFVYTRITTPLDVDFNATPVVPDESRSDTKTFRYYVQIDWGSRAIGELAKEAGFETIHYADIETIRVLSYWTQRYVHIYGIKRDPNGP